MNRPIYRHECEKNYPHGSDVLERDVSDNGFSRGWGMHFKPVPDYFFDAHIHYKGPREHIFNEAMRGDAEMGNAIGLRRALVFLQIYGKKWNYDMITDSVMDQFPYFTAAEIRKLSGGESGGRFVWAAYMNYLSSEPELVHAAADAGIRCIKLHNTPIIENNLPPDFWFGAEWRDTFNALAERNIPVNFHAVQRLSASPYSGGGRNSYWSGGWKNGTAYTNEDLLQAFLTLCRRYPKINWIGAHQLHLGWERLDELFTGYPNLYIDTSCGCILRLYDDFYDHDREYIREIFIRNADRILFGTDTFWGDAGRTPHTREMTLQHMRFITALNLPEDVLNKICHINAERLLKLDPLP